MASSILTSFPLLDSPVEIQLSILEELVCAKPWTIRLTRVKGNTKMKTTRPLAPPALFQVDELKPLVQKIIGTSKNGTIHFPHGCFWNILEDMKTSPGLATLARGIITVTFDQYLCLSHMIHQAKLAFPKLTTCDISRFPRLQIEMQYAWQAEIQDDKWSFCDIMKGTHDKDIVYVAGRAMRQPKCYLVNSLRGRLPADVSLSFTITLRCDEIDHYNHDDHDDCSVMNAEWIAFDMRWKDGVTSLVKKWFIDRASLTRWSKVAVMKEQEGWRPIREWRGAGRVDIEWVDMSTLEVNKETIGVNRYGSNHIFDDDDDDEN